MSYFGRRISNLRQHEGLPRLLVAQAPADFADWLDFVAVGALLVFHWNVGPIALAWLTFALGLPYVIVGPFMGRLVDHVPLRSALVISNIGRAVATLALVLPDTVPVLLATVFLRGCADSAFTPARQAAIQRLTPPAARTAANGMSHAINQTAKIAGPALGGLLLMVLEPQGVFVVNAVVSFGAALLMWTLPQNVNGRPDASKEEKPDRVSDSGSAWSIIRSRPKLLRAIALMSVGYFAMFFYDALIPLLTRETGHSEKVFGAAIAAVGAGGVLGAVFLSAAKEGSPFSRMAGGYFVSGTLVLIAGASAVFQFGLPAAAFILLFAVLGLSTALTVVPYRTVLQDETPQDSMGRVTSVGEASSTVALLIAPFAGAALAELLGVGASFVTGGAGLLMLACIAWITARRLE